jgi:signal transduction histidine kinase
MKALLSRFWPGSLTARLFVAVAITLLVTQSFNAFLLYRGQTEQRTAMLTNALTVRMVRGVDRLDNLERAGLDPAAPFAQRRRDGQRRGGLRQERRGPERRGRRGLDYDDNNPVGADWQRLADVESRLSSLLAGYNVIADQVIVARDPRPPILPLNRLTTSNDELADMMIIGAIKLQNGKWLSVRMPAPPGERGIRGWLIFQTITLYLILLGVIFYITRTLSRPLNRLNTAMGDFTNNQNIAHVPEKGPEDVAALTRNFNIMAERIGTMLDEKDIMLGAIGHDLKTPLSALRVRVESVKDDKLRSKMVASIEDLHQSLDEILLLARVGRGQEEAETVNIGALIDTIAEEFAQLDKPVALEAIPRIVGEVYVTWLRRAIRNLTSNAVRYGGGARISLTANSDDAANQIDGGTITIFVDDDGPGIAEQELDNIFTPFYRLEKSRNSQTGGAGLGLTLARAIAEKHGGNVTLHNRYDAAGDIMGLRAAFTFPRKQAP